MFIEFHIRDEAAKQLRDHVGNGIPVDPPGWSAEDRQKLRDLVHEVSWTDLMGAVDAAAGRLMESEDEASEERSDDQSKIGS